MSKLAKLRTQLRTVNIEYSALVRKNARDGFVRKAVLRMERHALMWLIAKERVSETRQLPHHSALQAA